MDYSNPTKKAACLKLITSHPFPYHFSRKQGLGIKLPGPFLRAVSRETCKNICRKRQRWLSQKERSDIIKTKSNFRKIGGGGAKWARSLQ